MKKKNPISLSIILVFVAAFFLWTNLSFGLEKGLEKTKSKKLKKSQNEKAHLVMDPKGLIRFGINDRFISERDPRIGYLEGGLDLEMSETWHLLVDVDWRMHLASTESSFTNESNFMRFYVGPNYRKAQDTWIFRGGPLLGAWYIPLFEESSKLVPSLGVQGGVGFEIVESHFLNVELRWSDVMSEGNAYVHSGRGVDVTVRFLKELWTSRNGAGLFYRYSVVDVDAGSLTETQVQDVRTHFFGIEIFWGRDEESALNI